ncbi:MAG: cation diffusion facilitator family transporter [Gammaproteobacteria bacterium]|nr:cation diffusion facilitator family transporter [Gammaproteobacteria bacterium]
MNGSVAPADRGLDRDRAVQRLRRSPHILAGPMLAVAIAGLLVNVLAFLVLRGGADLNTRGALAHVVGDMLGSVAAITAAGVIMATGWTQADPLLSLAVALIVRTGWKISRESAHILLEGTPDTFDATSIRDSLMDSVPGVCDVHHIHAWLIGSDEPHMTLHVQFAESVPADLAVAAVCSHLSTKFGIHHVTVRLEHVACATGALTAERPGYARSL